MTDAIGWAAFFDRIYVINLGHRTDRRREMLAEFGRVGIDAADPRITFFDAVRPADAGGFDSIGAHGCFMSHLGVLSSALAGGHDRILLLEDDADFTAAFAAAAGAETRARLDEDAWSIFYGGYAEDSAPGLDDIAAGVAAVRPDEPVSTTHMLAFQGRTRIADLVSYLTAMAARPAGSAAGGPMHVDGAYSWYRRQHPEALTLLAVPSLAVQRPSRTDIHALRWFDRLPVLRSAADLARRLKARRG